MKEQYLGDINDYYKYSILSDLGESLKVGVCWMLTPDDERSDGRKVAYLNNPSDWRNYHTTVYDVLGYCVDCYANLSELESIALIPHALYYKELLSERSITSRHFYFSRLLDRMSGVDLLFFDPDNGIEVASVSKGKQGSSKYIYFDELKTAWDKGYSILIYQHYPRVAREVYNVNLYSRLYGKLPGCTAWMISSGNVVFVLLPQDDHKERISKQLAKIRGRWDGKLRVTSFRYLI